MLSNQRAVTLASLILITTGLVGCHDSEKQDAGADAALDGDAESGPESDADTEPSPDADADTLLDADGSVDADANNDIDADAPVDADHDSGVDADSEPRCGNGVVESGEECDDGDVIVGDGCDASCLIETATIDMLSWSGLSGSYYRYAPSSIRSGDARYTYYCANLNSGEIRDHIIMRSESWNGSTWVPSAEQVAVWPGDSGTWDHRHVCDPEVLQGEFWYRRPSHATQERYNFALFYLGADATDTEGGINQIGWAVAMSLTGPWYKVVGSGPLVTAAEWWGVGQPSATSIDGAGDVLLFYTRGDSAGTRMIRQRFDLSDANSVIGHGEMELPTAGLADRFGNPDPINHAGALLYDGDRDRFWLIRNGHPYPSDCPDYVTDHLQVAWISAPSVWSGVGVWTVSLNITDRVMGVHRVFDGGFLRNPWGGLPPSGQLVLLPSVSATCPDSLWTYRFHALNTSP